MTHLIKPVASTITLVLALSTLVACLEPDDDPELAFAEVSLVATAAADVDHFFLLVRPVSSPTFTQTLLPASVFGTDSVASSLLTLDPGAYVFRAEAYDVANNLLGYPREVRADLIAGVTTPVGLVIDLSDYGDGEGDATADVLIVAQNGAEIDQSSITNANPSGSTPTTITIDSATDYEGDAINLGFIAMPGPAREWVSGSNAYTFALDEVGAQHQIIMAYAVDEHGVGTGHLYKFDTAASPTLTEVETVRVHDVYVAASGLTRAVVFSRADGSYFARFDTDGDYVADLDLFTGELLSWGIGSTNVYQVRARFPDGTIWVTDVDMTTGLWSDGAE